MAVANAGFDVVMAERFYLGAEPKAEGTIHFTLVVENPDDFCVEAYNDSRLPFVRERHKIIRAHHFTNYKINGVTLDKLVAEKIYEEVFLKPEK